MRLVQVQSENNWLKLVCETCGRLLAAREMVADLDGRPYRDYYCRECVKSLREQEI